MSAEFEASVRDQGASAVIDLSGEMNSAAESALMAAYAATGSATTVVLNFDRVEYINSTGIAVVVGLLAQARKDGKTIAAFGLMDHYREIFEITRLADFMSICSNEEEAVKGAPAGAV